MLEKKDNDNYEGGGETTQPETPEDPVSSAEENSSESPGDPVEDDAGGAMTDSGESDKETEESSKNQEHTEEESKTVTAENEGEASAEESSAIPGDPVEDDEGGAMTDSGKSDKKTEESSESQEHTEEESKTVTAENEGEASAEESSAIPEDPAEDDEGGAMTDSEESKRETEESSESQEHAGEENKTAVAGDEDEVQAEIDASNAEDAEDEDNTHRHVIPMPDYHAMSMEALAGELKKLVENEKVQAIKKHVEEIKHEFDLKYQELLEQKKDDFISDGGDAIDFKYTFPLKLLFNNIYNDYKEKRNQYYKNLEQTLNVNLAKRLEIIEELKALINVEEDINIIYRAFKELQDRWRKTGAVPRTNYNDLWRTYQHHIEIFYDFLDLNRDLRDIDFRKNLEEKEKIIAKAEELLKEDDVHKAFRELQSLHKIWKEDIGPVDREHREDIWKRFSNITRIIHQKRQDYFRNINAIHEENLLKKEEIIRNIEKISSGPGNSHGEWRKQIREVETLRKAFFEAGRIPYKNREKIWTAFKDAYRNFNRNKNAFYKKLKKEHHENLKKKMELLSTAESLKDSEDWEKTTPVMKNIQAEWSKIGHVPKKYSDEIWVKFKDACNHYFNRLHAQRGKAEKKQHESLTQKKELLKDLEAFTPGNDAEKDLEAVKAIVEQWRALSQNTYRKRSVEDKFNKTLGVLYAKLGLDKEQIELIKYGNKLEYLSHDDGLIDHERIFIRRRIGELKTDIRQLENNLQFINAGDDNPVVKEVVRKIDKHKEDLEIWEAKLRQLDGL